MLTTYYVERVLNENRGIAWARGADWLVGILRQQPYRNGTGVLEPGVGLGYGRIALPVATGWNLLDLELGNAIPLSWTASGDWFAQAAFTHFGIWDVAANLCAAAPLDAARTALSGQTSTFAENAIRWGEQSLLPLAP